MASPMDMVNRLKQQAMNASMYPGFSDSNIAQLDKDTASIPAEQKSQVKQQIYREVLPQLKARQEQEKRTTTKNELYNQSLNEKDTEKKKLLDLQVKVADFADIIREKAPGAVDINDNDIINKVVNALPNGPKLFEDYINGGDELLYVSGLKIRGEMSEQAIKTLLGDRYDIFKNDIAEEGIEKGTEEYYNAVKIFQENAPDDRNILQKFNDGYTNIADEIAGGIEAGGKLIGKAFGDRGDAQNTITEYVKQRDGLSQAEASTWMIKNMGEYQQLKKEYEANPELFAEYDTTASQDLLEIGEGAMATTWAAMPVATAGITALGATEGGEVALGELGQAITWGGKQVNKIVGLKDFKESLTTDEEKERFDALVGLTALMGAGKAKTELGIKIPESWTKAIKESGVENIEVPGNKSTALDSKTVEYINKGIKPTVAGKKNAADLTKFQENVVKGAESIIKNKENLKLTDIDGEITSGTPKTLGQYSEAIGQTKTSIYNEYNKIAKEAGETVNIDISNIGKELDTIIGNKALDLSSPGLRKYAETMKETIKDIEKLGVEEAQTLTQQLNQKLQAFYRNPNMNDIGKSMIDSLINNKLKESLSTTIEKASGDSRYTNLKSRYAELVSVEKEVAKRALVEARKANKGLLDFTDIFSAGEIVGGLASMSPAMIAKGLVQKGIKDWFKKVNSPDRNIKKLFERIEGGKVDINSLRAKNIKTTEKLETKTKTVNESIPELKTTVKAPKTTYRSTHQIDTKNSSPITSIENTKIDSYIEEFKRQYGYPSLKSKDLNKFKKVMENPEADIKIYRASPVNELNKGDWVTIDKTYANDIKRQNGGKVYEYTVKAKELLYPNTIEGFNELPSLNKRGAFQYN